MIHPSSFLRTCSLIAMCAVALAACATHDERTAARRHGSIKDEPADAAPKAERAPRAQRASHVIPAPARDVQTTDAAPRQSRSEPRSVVEIPSKAAASEPAPLLPRIEAPQPSVKVIVEAPPVDKAPPPAKSAALDPRPVAPAKPVEAQPAPVEPPKTTVVTPEPQVPAQLSRPPVVIKPVEPAVQQEARPTSEGRRRPPLDAVTPPRNAAVPPPAGVQQQAIPPVATAPPVAVPAPIAPPVAQPAPAIAKPEVKTEPKSDPKVAVLTDDQRVASILSSVDGYMKAGRFQNARTLLEDSAKSGNPRVLTALAETYDPLVLREQYPKLARTGDPEKAIALYEQAIAKGATSLAGRVTALRTLAGAKR